MDSNILFMSMLFTYTCFAGLIDEGRKEYLTDSELQNTIDLLGGFSVSRELFHTYGCISFFVSLFVGLVLLILFVRT